MPGSNAGSKSDLTLCVPDGGEQGEGEFTTKQPKKKNRARSRNNSIGEGKPVPANNANKPRSRNSSANQGKPVNAQSNKSRSRNSSANQGKPVAAGKGGKPNPNKGGKPGKATQQGGKKRGRDKANARNYENEEWRTVYIGFVARETTEEQMAEHFKSSGEIERLTLKDGFAFILFKEENSVAEACKLDGSLLNGLALKIAPRKEKPPEVDGEKLLMIDMKKFRNEKQERLFNDVEEFLQGYECVGSFSQDKKEPNSIVVPGCPPVLDWSKMDAEEGEITLFRQAENAPELNTTDSIFKSVSVCSPDLDFSEVQIVTNRQCLMKLLAPVDPSIVYTTNKYFRMTVAKSPKGPLFLNLEKKWHPTMGTAKSFQDSITLPLPQMVKNIAFPGIFYRINQFSLGKVTVMVRTQVHAEDAEPLFEFEDDGLYEDDDIDVEGGSGDEFFDGLEERTDLSDSEPALINGDSTEADKEGDAPVLSAMAAEWVPPTRQWLKFEGTDLQWIKNDAQFCQPESKYEVKTVDIGGNFWEYNAEKTFYQMLLGGVDYLMLGVLLGDTYVINKEEYDLSEVHAKVMGHKNPTDATLVLSKLERILSKMVELSQDLKEDERLEMIFNGKNEHLTFFKVKTADQKADDDEEVSVSS